MANLARGEIRVCFGDKEYTAAPTYHALAEIEDHLGPILVLAKKSVANDMGLKEAATVLYYCIREGEGVEHPTYDEVATLVVDYGIVKALNDVTKLIEKFLFGPKREEGKDQAPMKEPK